MRLIDADALLERMKHRKEYVGRPSDSVCLVEDAPTVLVDVQEPPEVVVYDPSTAWSYVCGNCREPLYSRKFKFCPFCGRRVKWYE